MPATLVAITGMPGSGKTSAARAMAELGYPVIAMGDVIRETAVSLGMEPTREILGEIVRRIREVKGPEAVARGCLTKIRSIRSPIVIVDGVRSLDEVRTFRREFEVVLVAIHCPLETRFRRLSTRGRPDDPRSIEDLRERDELELSIGLGSAIALADHVIVNEGTKEELCAAAQDLLRRVERELGLH